jgi:uroporphyrinogen decarboxylase
MTPKERAVAALELREPDLVPTFELEFQLCPELFGTDFVWVDGEQGDAQDRAIQHNADLHVRVAERLDYSIIRTGDTRVLSRLRYMGAGDRFLLCGEADGTMAIPDGGSMEDLAAQIYEEPEELHRELGRRTAWAIESGAKQIEAGAEMLTMCADYCFNTQPFLSPRQFAEFVFPYLAETIAAHRRNGAYVVKHTDGNLMPILDQIADAKPHGIHSLDPQGGVDIAEVKRRVGDRLCLCGNVNCALLQTGTLEEVRASAEYALRNGMPGGGFIYSTSNVAFKGMELERYLFLLDIRQELGWYSRSQPSPSSAQ